MEYLGYAFGFFGFLAFIQLSSVKGRIANLERLLSEKGVADIRPDLFGILEDYVGAEVEISFYEDEEEIDVLTRFQNRRKGDSVRIVDYDEKWVLVQASNAKEQKKILIRLSSIKGLTKIEKSIG